MRVKGFVFYQNPDKGSIFEVPSCIPADFISANIFNYCPIEGANFYKPNRIIYIYSWNAFEEKSLF